LQQNSYKWQKSFLKDKNDVDKDGTLILKYKCPKGNFCRKEENKLDGYRLKSLITQRGKSITEVLTELKSKHNMVISRTAFYRKMKGINEFDRSEILALTKILKLSDDEMLEIFFK